MSSDFGNNHYFETYKSLVALATEGFKFVALINGGAAVALLSYLGSVSGTGHVPDMRSAMFMFLGGLACCGVSMLFAYLTQLRRLNDIAENTNTKPSWRLSVALVFFILGLVLFISGAWLAVTGFE